VERAIHPSEFTERVADPACGAVSLFVGTARLSSSEKTDGTVVKLDYEAYVPMAETVLRAIAQESVDQFRVEHVIIHHRIGSLNIGDAAVVAVVAAPHRSQAFDACRYVIEELKKRAPIWKKEGFSDGSAWVNAHP